MTCELCTTPPGNEPNELDMDDLCEECRYWIREAIIERKQEGEAA